MIIGYARLSTAGESLGPQKDALDRAGIDRLFTDVPSATRRERPQLEHALAQLRHGDTLVVWKLDRLGRSLRPLIEMVADLGRRGIGFRSLQEDLDTTTGTDQPLSHLFAALAESERARRRERTAAARAAAKARGPRGGRPPKLDQQTQAQVVVLSKDQGKSVEDTCRKLGISRATFYRYLRQGRLRMRRQEVQA